MKNTQEQTNYSPNQTAQFWNAETKEFETWFIGDCDICGEALDKDTGECKQYKCCI